MGSESEIEEALPGPLKGNIGYSLQSVLGTEGFAQAAVIEWNGWNSLKEEALLAATDPTHSDEVALSIAQQTVARHIVTFLRIAADNVGNIPAVSDAEAMARYRELGYTIGTGCVHGQNDCMSDSLLQCLSVAQVLPARLTGPGSEKERALACNAVRQHLLGHEQERLRPVPWNGFLVENVHGPEVVLFFLRHFEQELLQRPAEIELVTHSRFDACAQKPGKSSPISPAITSFLTRFDAGAASEVVIELHLYNETGRGCGGLHFSPILWLAQRKAEPL